MAGQFGCSWFRSPKSKGGKSPKTPKSKSSTNSKSTPSKCSSSSPARGGSSDCGARRKGPPSRSFLRRVSMTLPPTPHDLAREDARLAGWGRSCIDSPPHVYEEIPEELLPPGNHNVNKGTTKPRLQMQLSGSSDEYLKPSTSMITIDEVLAQQRPAPHRACPRNDTRKTVVRDVPARGVWYDLDLCKYDKISPLSALGLTMASLKKCSRCRRPHGVYNGTIYRHGGSNSSPDLFSLESSSQCYHATSCVDPNILSKGKVEPVAANQVVLQCGTVGTNASCGAIPRFYSTNDLCSQDYDRPWQYDYAYRPAPVLHSTPVTKQTTCSPAPPTAAACCWSASTAFQVLQPAGHRQLTELVTKKCPEIQVERFQDAAHHLEEERETEEDADYQYHLSRVKHLLELSMEVQGKRVKSPEQKSLEASGAPGERLQRNRDSIASKRHSYEHPIKEDSIESAAQHGSNSEGNQAMSLLDLEYYTEQVGYTPLTKPYYWETGGFHTLNPSPKSPTGPSKSTAATNSLSVSYSDKLSCRATDFTLGSQRNSRYGSHLTLRDCSVSEPSVYAAYGNVQRSGHNPLLSDIMRRNHDRQNLVL